MAAKLRWDTTPVEVREEWLRKGREAFEAKYPHRVRLYEDLQAKLTSGEIRAEPCDRCGREGRMMLRFDDEAETVELVGWRCFTCRGQVRQRA